MKTYYLIFMVCFFSACGSSDNGSSNHDFTGTYKGTETGTQNGVAFSQTVTAILTQNGASLIGTWASGSGGAGSVSGTVSGDLINGFTLITSACSGSVTGTSQKTDSNGISGSISGTSPSCGISSFSASFSLSKQ